jgi:beta-lactam-binding protein with PASTA domain
MNVLIGFGVAVCLFVIFFFSLGWITGNGETEKVPAVIGLDVLAAEKNLTALGFEVVLKD